MVLDAMNDMHRPNGIGFRSVLRVRMLHCQVRLRLLKSSQYDVQKFGVPINQEDLLATLGSFSVACVWSMERMGIFLTAEEKESYIAAWKYIGYFIGIEAELLERFYCDFHAAEKHLCSSIAHLLEPEQGKPSGVLPLQLLNAIARRPLYGHSLEYHAELSRLLIGDQLANIFQLPRGNWRTRCAVKANLLLMELELWFGKWYRPGWEMERVRLTRVFVDWLVMWQVGKRQAFERTDFGYRVGVMEEKVKGNIEMSSAVVDSGKGGDLDGNIRVHVDRTYIRSLKRRYYRLVVFEPVVVVSGVLCSAGLTLWYWSKA